MVAVLVCRGSSCGTPKHPFTDHDGQLATISEAVQGVPSAELRVVDCLDSCSRSNVIVIRDQRPGVAPAQRSTWLGNMLTDELTSTLCAWLTEGGPITNVPAELRPQIFFGPYVDVPANLRTTNTNPNTTDLG
jgi:hypothetical protein